MWAFSWVLIPIAGILAGAWSEWLKFKEKQSKLGASAETLEAEFEKMSSRLEEQNRALIDRIQNLEAIVTSPDWDAITLPPALPESSSLIDVESPENVNTKEAASLAQKIRS